MIYSNQSIFKITNITNAVENSFAQLLSKCIFQF